MPPALVAVFRVGCVAAGLFLATARAAEPKQHPLVGATRAQIVARFGEPRSQILAGNREVLFFDRERFELVDQVVTFVERIASDSSVASPAPVAELVPPAETAGAMPAVQPGAPVAREGEERLQIRAVRSRDATAAKDATGGKGTSPSSNTPVLGMAPKLGDRKNSPAGETLDAGAAAELVSAAPGKKSPGSAVQPEKKTQIARQLRPPGEADLPTPGESVFAPQTYAIAAVVIFGGLGYLMWRRRQRQIEIAVSSVSQSPFPVAPPTPSPAVADSTRFAADLLGSLDAKRFVALVASYYSRTGVVATVINANPASPVHIRISWKGEPRPFANVQCVSRPPAPIDVKPLKELLVVLAAEDIRRGYVVTTGDFTPEAQTFAEANQLTLLSGVTLLEKLNALPESARKELRRETTSEAPGSS